MTTGARGQAQSGRSGAPPEGGVYRLTAEDRAAIEISREQARQSEFVPDSEMEEFWRGYGA